MYKRQQIQYNGENIPIFFENTGAPVSITIAMSFQEVQIYTKDGFQAYENNQLESTPTSIKLNAGTKEAPVASRSVAS